MSAPSRADVLQSAAPAAEPVIYGMRLGDEVRVVLLVPEVAQLLRMSTDKVYALIRSGQLRVRNLYPGSRNGRKFDFSALVEYLQGADDPIPEGQ